jgi:hypothetical protein
VFDALIHGLPADEHYASFTGIASAFHPSRHNMHGTFCPYERREVWLHHARNAPQPALHEETSGEVAPVSAGINAPRP